MASLSIIFSGANLTMRISEYLQLTDSMSSRISRLERMHQRHAQSAFQNALRTNDDNLRCHYILEAINKYSDAEHVETDDQALFGVYVGLACCHGFLNDNANRNVAIQNVLKCYDRVKSDANDEPEGFIEMQSNGDEGTEMILKVAWGIYTLGTANLLNSGIKKVQQLKIDGKKKTKGI